MKKRTLQAVLLVLFAAQSAAAAVNDSAGLIFPGMSAGSGARAASLGGAFTAVADDASAAGWNPAGLPYIINAEIGISYDKWIMDSYQSRLVAAVPAGPGVMGMDIFYADSGVFDIRNDAGQATGGTISHFSLAVMAAYGMKFGSQFSAGLTARYLMQSAGSAGDMGFSADAAVLYRQDSFSAGLVLQNIGAAGGYSLPFSVKAGTAYYILKSGDHTLMASADAGFISGDGPCVSAGVEYGLGGILDIRAGYRMGFAENEAGAAGGITAGAGFNAGNFSIDYGFVPYGDLGLTHSVMLRYRFLAPFDVEETPVPGKKAVPADAKKTGITLYNEALELEKTGKLEEAEQKYRQVTQKDKANTEALKRLGAVLFKLGRESDAIQVFEAYLRLKPDDKAVSKWLEKQKQKWESSW